MDRRASEGCRETQRDAERRREREKRKKEMLEIRLEIDMKGGRGGEEDEYGREKTGRVF